jgi:O-antigen/teichoic acid export membrane protein
LILSTPALARAHRRVLRRAWLVGSFLFGQGLVQALTLIVGLALVRVLPVEQYALYTIAGGLLAVVSLGSNFGLGHAIISLGAGRRDDRGYVGALWQASRRFSAYLFPLAALVVLGLAAWMFHRLAWSLTTQFVCVAMVVGIGLVQIDTALGRAVFNMHHDAATLFRVGLAEVLVRLVLVAACLVWPLAIVALAANLLGASAARYVTSRRTALLLDHTAVADDGHRRALKAFVLPLAPMVIYTLLQGQIAIFMLSTHANTQAIAELGALNRLSQLFAVLMMLNSFLVQPIFARVTSSRDFLVKLALVIAALAALCAVGLASAYAVPHWWLFLLGQNYSGLTQELPIAIGTAFATVVGATLYMMVIARGDARGQSLAILPCLGGQLAFITAHGVGSTWDALILALIPALAYAVVQAALLARILQKWPEPNPMRTP